MDKLTIGGIVGAAALGGVLVYGALSDPIAKDIKPVMIVCQDVKGALTTKWDIDPKDKIPDNCKQVSAKAVKEDQVSSTAKGMSALETELTTLCYPCKITPGQWGHCPYCQLYPGGCASVCKIQEPIRP